MTDLRPQPLVLYVDSNPAGAAEFRKRAKGWPVRLKMVPNAQEAAAVIHREAPSLVISENQLDDAHGLALLAGIRGMFPETGVILYTAETKFGVQSVDVPVLFRPCTEVNLEATVRGALNIPA